MGSAKRGKKSKRVPKKLRGAATAMAAPVASAPLSTGPAPQVTGMDESLGQPDQQPTQ